MLDNCTANYIELDYYLKYSILNLSGKSTYNIINNFV